MLGFGDFVLEEQPEDNLTVAISRAWYNGSYTMAVKPIKSLELHLYNDSILIVGDIPWPITRFSVVIVSIHPRPSYLPLRFRRCIPHIRSLSHFMVYKSIGHKKTAVVLLSIVQLGEDSFHLSFPSPSSLIRKISTFSLACGRI